MSVAHRGGRCCVPAMCMRAVPALLGSIQPCHAMGCSITPLGCSEQCWEGGGVGSDSQGLLGLCGRRDGTPRCGQGWWGRGAVLAVPPPELSIPPPPPLALPPAPLSAVLPAAIAVALLWWLQYRCVQQSLQQCLPLPGHRSAPPNPHSMSSGSPSPLCPAVWAQRAPTSPSLEAITPSIHSA